MTNRKQKCPKSDLTQVCIGTTGTRQCTWRKTMLLRRDMAVHLEDDHVVPLHRGPELNWKTTI